MIGFLGEGLNDLRFTTVLLLRHTRGKNQILNSKSIKTEDASKLTNPRH